MQLQDPSLLVKVYTPAEIAQKYAAALDSVSVVNKQMPYGADVEEWTDYINRNKSYLVDLLKLDVWTTEDLTPLQDAVKE